MDKAGSDADTRPRVMLVSRAFIARNSSPVSYLFVKRSLKNRHNPGKWEVPGGKLDEGEDLHVALAREIKEEVGFSVVLIDSLALVKSYVIAGGPYQGLPYVVLFHIAKVGWRQPGDKDGIRLSDEHTEFRWATPEEALILDLSDEVREAVTVLQTRLGGIDLKQDLWMRPLE